MIITTLRRIAVTAALFGALTVAPAALAYPGAGGIHGGAHFTGSHVGAHYAGGYAGRYYGGYGGRYYGGWRGWGWCCGWGWGWGFYGAGLWLATLPWYYETYWWGGVPYYYVDNVYYRWDAGNGRYQAVAAPTGVASAQPPSTDLFMYPKGGQSADQQAKDKYECHRWAADQSGFDPTHADGGVPVDQTASKRADYVRAEGACLEGRNYSVR
jgi:hypothetical protein